MSDEPTLAEKLRTLADWFDQKDAMQGWTGSNEVQTDLRHAADLLEPPLTYRWADGTQTTPPTTEPRPPMSDEPTLADELAERDPNWMTADRRRVMVPVETLDRAAEALREAERMTNPNRMKVAVREALIAIIGALIMSDDSENDLDEMTTWAADVEPTLADRLRDIADNGGDECLYEAATRIAELEADLRYTLSWMDEAVRAEFMADPDGARIWEHR